MSVNSARQFGSVTMSHRVAGSSAQGLFTGLARNAGIAERLRLTLSLPSTTITES